MPIDFIKRHRDEPFFVYYSMALVHWPFVPVPGMDGDRDGVRNGPEAQKNFVAMVEHMDQLVGRLVDTLEQQGLREQTLVLFTGDNATARSLRTKWNDRTIRGGKGNLTEAGTRVPLIARWKGSTPQGDVSSDLIDFTDFLPTFASIAGVDVPEDHTVDGRSFLPQLKGKKGNPREWVFAQLGTSWFLRTQRWRLRKNDGYEFADMSDRYDPNVIKQPDGNAAKAKKRLQNVAEQLLPKQYK